MHIGASMAGSAFSNSQIGLAHALGHALGSHFRVPHGMSVGLYLPSVVRFNSQAVPERYRRLNSLVQMGYGRAPSISPSRPCFRKWGGSR